ncbi:MAG: class I SAM-dependent methyltransferase [Acidobacteriota bacterium]
MNPAARAVDYQYEGAELDLFEKAVNWKAYWSSRIARYLRGDVLEVGAGIGANTALFATHAFDTWTCLEPDAALAARIVLPAGSRHHSRIGTTAALDAADQYDAILYIDVLEHIEEDAVELARASRHLRAGGHLIVLSPAWPFLFSPFDAAIGHYRRYTRAMLRAAARSTHFDEQEVIYLDSAGMLASAANCLLLRSAIPTLGQILLWDRRLVPISRRIDRFFGEHVGKTIIGVWEKPDAL